MKTNFGLGNPGVLCLQANQRFTRSNSYVDKVLTKSVCKLAVAQKAVVKLNRHMLPIARWGNKRFKQNKRASSPSIFILIPSATPSPTEFCISIVTKNFFTTGLIHQYSGTAGRIAARAHRTGGTGNHNTENQRQGSA